MCVCLIMSFLDGYCCTVQELLDWFEVDLGFTEGLFLQIGLCVKCDMCVCLIVSLQAHLCCDIVTPHLKLRKLRCGVTMSQHNRKLRTRS